METYKGIACGNETKMTRIWNDRDFLGRSIKPIPLVKCEQDGNTVILTQRHFEVAFQKWFSNKPEEIYQTLGEMPDLREETPRGDDG